MVRYFWYDGSEIDEARFEQEFGAVTVVMGDARPFGEVELRAAVGGYPTCIVHVVDKAGAMQTAERVRYTWPGGSYEVEVKATGSEVNMGRGENFGGPPNVGPGAVQVTGLRSPTVNGVGWYDNYRHFDVVFRVPETVPDPEPDPEPPEDVADVVAKLRLARDLLTDVIVELEG